MIKKIIFTSFLAFAIIACNAQFKGKKQEKIRAYKVAFLTDKLDLTEKEAQKFWPLYNIYEKKIMELREEEFMGIRRKINNAGGLENLSENQAKEIIEKITLISEERHKTKTAFYNKIDNFLSYKKILQLEVSEHEFDRKLFRKFRQGGRNRK